MESKRLNSSTSLDLLNTMLSYSFFTSCGTIGFKAEEHTRGSIWSQSTPVKTFTSLSSLMGRVDGGSR
jgi:hypothetical protein